MSEEFSDEVLEAYRYYRDWLEKSEQLGKVELNDLSDEEGCEATIAYNKAQERVLEAFRKFFKLVEDNGL